MTAVSERDGEERDLRSLLLHRPCSKHVMWSRAMRCLLFAILGFLFVPDTTRSAAIEIESLRALVRAQGVSGREEAVREVIRSRLPSEVRSEVDNLGNLTLRMGSGSPVRLLIAPLDEPGYLVSQIRQDGYLRVQRITRLPLSPLYDQFLVGQPVQVRGRSGIVPGVSIVLSTHLQRGRRPDPFPPRPPVAEDLLIDVGARSASEVEEAGIDILAPVTLQKELTEADNRKIQGPIPIVIPPGYT